ncbi:MAG: amino acid ABC transporter permease [Candidatus Marinimicrobia bacterium]|jgi:polar amino acid transport system permease protein|nr:amino acid ABC transporter permease [Candidatus Neomarinimicrobiota bacterium]
MERLIEEIPNFFTYWNIIFLLKAMGVTLMLTLFGCIFGFAFGLILAIVRKSENKLMMPLRIFVVFFTEIFRRIPFLVTLLLIFYVFQIFQITDSLFVIALISVCLIATAFIGEIIRSGIESINMAQWDAAKAMNFSYLQILKEVIFPQAWKVILPPAFGFFILFIKDTALASQIGVMELTFAGKILNNKGFSPVLVFGSILILYFILSFPLDRFGKYMERKIASGRN